MFGFGRKRSDLHTALMAENSDLRQTLREEREAWAAERKELVDRIIALANPAILREVRREAASVPKPIGPNTSSAEPWRPNYPGVDRPFPHPERKDGDRILDDVVANLRAERARQ